MSIDPLVATVVPDVTGLDKEFDYLIPDDLSTHVHVGTIVRVDLHGRRIGGWVRSIGLSDRPHDSLKPIVKITGHGPAPELFDLALWASTRWAARRIRPFLVTASPSRAVPALPERRRTGSAPAPQSPATTELLAAGGGVLRLPPRVDLMPMVLSAAAVGPLLVVVPEHADAALFATRLRRAGLSVALMPDEWAAAAAGVDVVIGARSVVWAPCPDLAAIVVVDEHDEALQQERAPTWHARDVAVERARRAAVPCVLASPIPTLVAVEEYARGAVVHPPPARERPGWPRLVVVDRTDEEPWKRSLVTSPLIERLRNPDLSIVCVSNITGRARVLACRSCRVLLRCEHCDAAVGLDDDGHLACRRCSTRRPPVCQACGAGRFANLRPGVTRLREELEAAAARPVVAITGADDVGAPLGGITIGTEAVLHRTRSADVVAFLEFDSEMLAPRYRAAEQSLALIVRAGRIAPEVLVQTFTPDHPVLAAADVGDPSRILAGERDRREMLGFPPYGALVVVSGAGAAELLSQLGPPDRSGIEIGGDGDDRFVVRGPDWLTVGAALNSLERPARSRIRIEVDPPRL